MRIGVLTYHCVPNFGAQLQALSTIGYLRHMGHEAILINWYAKDLEEMYAKRIPSEQILCQKTFAEEHLPLTAKCQSIEALVSEVDSNNLDAIIAGSDALFKYIPLNARRHFSKRRLKYIYHFTPLSCELLEGNPFFGAFLNLLRKKIPAGVYAASSQNCPYPLMTFCEKRKMAIALSNYKIISVRDSWTQKMIETITGKKKITINPDPVFSFNQNCSSNIPSKEDVLSKYNLPNNYLLFSFSDWYVNEEYIDTIAKEASLRGLTPVALPMPEKLVSAHIEHAISLPLSPLWWYALIIHSCGYIGERMHPIVVCLHNSVPFFCFDEYGAMVKKNFDIKSSKTYAIVADAGLENNLHSYKLNASLPTAIQLLNQLLAFDKIKCKEFAKRKREEYQRGMNEILTSFQS